MLKIIKTSLIFSILFSGSAASTVAISQQFNKTPVPNVNEDVEKDAPDVEEDEDEEDIDIPPARVLTDTEKFVASLTEFGNLKASIDADITYESFSCGIKGDLFVSLETLEDLAIQANLSITIPSFELNVGVVYDGSSVYVHTDNNKFKFDLNDVSQFKDLLDYLNVPFELPDIFTNIDTNQLLTNIGAMVSSKDDSTITYTCSLIDGLPPVIFTSDLSYNMTSVSLHNANIEGVVINIDGQTTVLGKGHNEIVVPQDTEQYIDITNYIGIAKQIGDLVKCKQFGINYELNIKENDTSIISSTGNASLDLNDLKVSLDASLKIKDEDFDLYAAYINDKVYFNLNDLFKFSYSKDKITDLIDIIKTNLGEDSLTSLLDKLGMNTMPIVTAIQNENYLSLLDYYDSVKFSAEEIVLTINNQLFGNNIENAKITIKTPQKAIKSVEINNLVVGDYVANLSVELDSYVEPKIDDESSYNSLDNSNGFISNMFSLVKEEEFAVNFNGSIVSKDGTTSFHGDTQFNIDSLSGFGNIAIIDKTSKTHNVAIDIYDDSTMYFSYNKNLNGKLTLGSIRDVIAMVKTLIDDGNPRLNKYSDSLITDYLQGLINNIKAGNYLSLVNSGLIKSFAIADGNYEITLNGELLDSENDIIIIIGTKEDKLYSLDLSLSAFDMDINFHATLEAWNDNYSRLDIDNMKFYDFTDLSTLVQYLFTTGACNDFSLSGTLTLNMNIISIIKKEFDLGVDISVHIDEDENVVSCLKLTNIPHLSSLAQSENWDYREFDIFISDEYVNLQIMYYKDSTKMTGFLKFETVRTTTYKQVHLTNEEMVNDLIYYFVNFGLGIDKIDLDKTSSSDTKDPDYSKILTNYSYSDDNAPTWNIGINIAELAGNDMLSDLNATIKGDTSTNLLDTLSASINIDVYSLIEIAIKLNASLDSVEYIGDAKLNSINEFNDYCLTLNNKDIKTSSSSQTI